MPMRAPRIVGKHDDCNRLCSQGMSRCEAQNCAVEAEPGSNRKCFRAPRNRTLVVAPEAAPATKSPESHPAILLPVFSYDELYRQSIPDSHDSRRLLWHGDRARAPVANVERQLVVRRLTNNAWRNKSFASPLAPCEVRRALYGPLFGLRRGFSISPRILWKSWPYRSADRRSDWSGNGSTVGIGTACRTTS